MLKKAKPLEVGFHAFTYKGEAFSGTIGTFEAVEAVVQFTYDYVENGISVVGSYTGVRDGDTVDGAWKEQSQKPIEGKTSWQGGALLTVIESHGRQLLTGTWTFDTKPSGRWTLDVPA